MSEHKCSGKCDHKDSSSCGIQHSESTSVSSVTTANWTSSCGCNKVICSACCGSGYQTTFCGIKIECPVCCGTGYVTEKWYNPCDGWRYKRSGPWELPRWSGDSPRDYGPTIIC